MTLRSKLSAIVSAFLLLTTLLAVGSFLIFNTLNKSFDVMEESIKAHNMNEELEASITGFITAAEAWAITGDARYRSMYKKELANTYKNFGLISVNPENKDLISVIGSDFEELRVLSKNIISVDEPTDKKDVIQMLKLLENREGEVIKKLHSLHATSINAVVSSAERGDRIKDKMAFYLAMLFILSSLAFLLLALFMRKTIAVPFNYILTATDRIIAGDLNYRIASKRTDEFGTIADRFDRMVAELQGAGLKNEELYLSTKNRLERLSAMTELAKAVTSALDLDELLNKIVENAAKLLHAKGCVLRLLEDNKLVIKTSYGLQKADEGMMTVSIGEGLPGKVALEGKPLFVDDLSKMPSEWKIPYLDARSVMNVPLKAGETVIGTLGLYDKMSPEHNIISFSSEDLYTLEGFASLSAIAINKARLFEQELKREREAVNARKRLDVFYNSVHGGIISVNKDYKILLANNYMENWADIPAEDMPGKNCAEVFHEKTGVCPHCVAQITLETGQVNHIAQASGTSYAELTAYPVRDETGNIGECVVFIRDITDIVMQQEELMALYKEVAQTKDHLVSIIDNSSDAIVTSDLNGIITSWNNGAEKIYGFTEAEAIGRYLPFVPENLKDMEKTYADRVRNGEVLKTIEATRQKKNGSIIEVSLALSPVKNPTGEIIGISGISRDISEKKRIENELIRRNQELSRLFFISSVMRSTLELDRLLRMILTAVTMGDGLGFNRAALFLVDDKNQVLRGSMAVGPASHEEAGSIWNRLYIEKQTLEDVMQDLETKPLTEGSFLDRLSRGIEISLDAESILSRSVREQQPFNVLVAKEEPLSDPVLIQQLGTEAYAVVPLTSRGRTIGLLWVDNLFNKRGITDEDIKFLTAFSNQIASAIESAKLFEQIAFAEAELENIFMSMSDMVYITDLDCRIKNVNKAVIVRFGLPEDQIIGQKCYKFFHGLSEPSSECPHLKALESKKPFMEEHDDPYLGGTFLSSCSPILDASGNVKGTVHIARDITELKKIREKLVRSERMAALGEVAAKVAHEIRNPLVSVGGFAARLEKKLDGNLKEYATIITDEVKKLELKLKDILGFVRETRLALTQVDINELLLNTINLLQPEAVERGISIETTHGEIPSVLADPDRLREAFINIITNSMQAIVNNGKISVATYTDNGFAVAEISDTGPGIAEKDFGFIFDPFYTTKAYGTGLGLSITRRIIEEHKGRIEASSSLGKGTVMKIFLPLEKEAA